MLQEDGSENLPGDGAWTNTVRAVRIANRPALLHGVVILASSDGGRATVYAGVDDSGRKVGTFRAFEECSMPVTFSPPLRCDAGIYVGDFSHIDEVLIHWSVI